MATGSLTLALSGSVVMVTSPSGGLVEGWGRTVRTSRSGSLGGGKRREEECEVDGRTIVVCKEAGVRAIERESVGTERREGGLKRGRLEDKGWGGTQEESIDLKIDIYLGSARGTPS